MKALGVARSLLGATLLWGSAGAAGYAIAWTVRSHDAAAHVMSTGDAGLAGAKSYDASSDCKTSVPKDGQLAGYLEVPTLDLKAPVEQGESQQVLSAAIGHDVSSVWPGADGTAVLAAHDVSYFSRIGSLPLGAEVIYVDACRTVTFEVTGHKIVKSGSPVANSAGPTVVLDTCYPNDALWWTPDRELVEAKEVSSRPTSHLSPSHTKAAKAMAPIAVPAPPSLVAQGLTLDTNPTLLGTMSVTGKPDADFVQSPGPLDVEQAALTAYYGALHALETGNQSWWQAVAPGVSFPSALSGASVEEYLTRLTVDVEATGMRPYAAVLRAEVELDSPSDGTVDVSLEVVTAIHDGELTVTRWAASP